MKPENATRLCSTVHLTCMWLIVRLFHMHISYDYDFVYKVLVFSFREFYGTEVPSARWWWCHMVPRLDRMSMHSPFGLLYCQSWQS